MAATAKVMDFTNVKDAGQFNPMRVPAGDYRAKITAVADHKKEGEKTSVQWVFTLQLVDRQRATYPYYANHVDVKFAWKVRNLCLAAGLNAPKKKVKVDPNKLVGKIIGIALDDDEYEGKKKSVIVATFPASDVTATPKPDEDNDEDVDDVDTDEGDDDLEDVDLEEV